MSDEKRKKVEELLKIYREKFRGKDGPGIFLLPDDEAIALMENAIRNNKPFTYKDMGFTDEQIRQIENGEIDL